MLIPPAAHHVAWMDDTFTPWNEANLSVTAHHYGFGVFEGTRSYATKNGAAIFRLNDHTHRLLQSAHILNFASPFTQTQLNSAQIELIKRNKLLNAYLRPMIFFDGLMGYSLYTQKLQIHTLIIALGWQQKTYREAIDPKLTKELKLQTSSLVRNHPNSIFLKAKANGNYMNSIMALREAIAVGADDALLLDQQGFVAEASAANIFMVRKNILYTPSLTAALPGITRDCIFTLASELGLEIIEKSITRDELYIADEIFLTGTATEITPVTVVDQRRIGSGVMGPLTQTIRELFFSYVYGVKEDNYGWLSYVDNTPSCQDAADPNILAIIN